MELQRVIRPAWAALLFAFGLHAAAQGPATRLAGSTVSGPATALAHSRPPRASAANDIGAVSPQTPLKSITLTFNRSTAQETALQALLAAQQNPSSPQYHQWLTPEQFAAQFGVADADLAAVQNWLQTQGFTVKSVARSRNRIVFSGTAAQVATAFGTELHHYLVNGVTHFAPASDLSLPATLAPLVASVSHLSDFRPAPAIRRAAAKPNFTSATTEAHFLTPGDLATMYDVTSVYNAGYTGAGQSIAIVGQSAIDATDVSRFQTAAGLPSNLPSQVLVPGTGVAAIIQDGEEAEGDLDVEYATGMAKNASIFFVYVGDDSTAGAFDAIGYAVDENIAPIISSSYGECELDIGASEVDSGSLTGEQANAQGQTIVSAAGDTGSTDCYGYTDLSSVVQEGLAVDFPGVLSSVTSVGGLEMAAGTYATGSSSYWTSASGSDSVSSLVSYVPETVWNEDSSNYGISAGGGGTSTLVARPTWQTGVPGIPAGTFRLVPDVALQASTDSPGYILCTSDFYFLGAEDITSSCTSGFRDSASGALVVAGGTSFAAPVFSGLLAVLNQAKHATGQGNVNPTLYSLASNATTYASAFHDVTMGTNACTAGTSYCDAAGESGYTAGTGYDEASGLGSIDFANLVAAWPTTAATALAASTTSLSASTATPASAATDAITITVASGTSGGAAPTGTVAVYLSGDPTLGTPNTTLATTLTLANGQVSYTFPGSATIGTHIVTAIYSGDGTYAASQGAVGLTVGPTAATGSFTLATAALTVASNNYNTGTVAVTPAAGYTGVVNFTMTFPSDAPTLCYYVEPANITAGLTTQFEIAEGTTECGTVSEDPMLRQHHWTLHKGVTKQARVQPQPQPSHVPEWTSLAGLFLAGFAFRRRSRRLAGVLAVGVLVVLGLGLTGCGSSNAVTTPTAPTAPTTPTSYTVTLTGTDSVTSSITSSTTFALTIQ